MFKILKKMLARVSKNAVTLYIIGYLVNGISRLLEIILDIIKYIN